MPSTKRAPSPAKKSAKPAAAKRTATDQSATKRKTTALVAKAQKISNADRTKAEALLAEIARRKQRITEDFYDIGLALAQIFKKKLFLALGYASFEELLQTRNVMNSSTARGLIRLVTTMKRDEALAYGQEKAIALLSYAKTTPELDTPKTLMEEGTLPDGKPVADASVRDIKKAAQRVRAAQGKAAPPSPEAKAAQTEVKALGTWLRARGATKAKISVIRDKGAHLLRIELPVSASVRLRSS